MEPAFLNQVRSSGPVHHQPVDRVESGHLKAQATRSYHERVHFGFPLIRWLDNNTCRCRNYQTRSFSVLCRVTSLTTTSFEHVVNENITGLKKLPYPYLISTQALNIRDESEQIESAWIVVRSKLLSVQFDEINST